MSTQLSTTDYQSIANCILANRPDESKAFELEYETTDYVMFLEVSYDFDTKELIGGSFEGRDFENLTEVYNETFDVVSCEIYSIEGEPIETDFNENILLNLLNN